MEVCGCHAAHTCEWPYGDQEVDTAQWPCQLVGAVSKNTVLLIIGAERKSPGRQSIVPYTCLKVPVELLDKTICLWTVRCDTEACSTREVHEGMQRLDSNCCPQSEVIVVVTPKREVQPVRKAEVQDSRVTSTIGIAGQRV